VAATEKKDKFSLRGVVREKVPFRPQFLYAFIIFFNIIVLAFSMYMVFTNNTEPLSRVILEAVVIVVIFFFFLYALSCLYDARYFKSEWSLLAKLQYKGYVMQYALAHIFGHTILVVFIAILYVNGQSNLTYTLYDILAIMISFALIVAGILVNEPPYESQVLPVTVTSASVTETKSAMVTRVAPSTQSSLINNNPK
jgi:hypothetical protein